MVEQLTLNQFVVGSSPTIPTTIMKLTNLKVNKMTVLTTVSYKQKKQVKQGSNLLRLGS